MFFTLSIELLPLLMMIVPINEDCSRKPLDLSPGLWLILLGALAVAPVGDHSRYYLIIDYSLTFKINTKVYMPIIYLFSFKGTRQLIDNSGQLSHLLEQEFFRY